MNETQTALIARIDELISDFSGRVGVSANNLTTGDQLQINEVELFPALSAIKVAIMADLFRRVHSGDLRLEEPVQVHDDDLRGGTGVLRELDMPLTLTLKDVCMLMIVVSDNSCTHVLAEKLGTDRINEGMRALGLNEIELRAGLRSDTFKRFGAKSLDAFSVSSPRDLTALVSMIARGEMVSREACDQMLDIMSRCQHIEYLGRYLPVDPYCGGIGLESQSCSVQ